MRPTTRCTGSMSSGLMILLLIFLTGCDRATPPAPSKPTVAAPPAARPANLPTTANSFSTAKKWLYEKVYYDHPKTFYCGCDYSRSAGQAGQIHLQSCGVEVRQDQERAQRLEAEHVFPAAQFGNFRPCWREPARFPACVKSDGQTLSGRQCCEKVDPLFEAAHNDLYNLFPAEGEINGDRKDYNWGMVSGARRDYGSCAFKIDAGSRRENPFISQYAAQFGKTAPTTSSTATPKATVTVKCGAKTTCSQMSSCEEATAYLQQCGVTRLDGDGDGVPCASLCNR